MKKPYKLSGLIKSGAVVPGDAEPFTMETIGSSESVESVATSTGTTPKSLIMIRVDTIDPNPLAPREVYTPQMIKDRAEALRTQGQHDPIHVIPNPDVPGRFIICDGWTRVQACRDHQVMHELLADVHEGMTLEQSAWFGYQQNEERQQHCDLDRAMFYEKLIATGVTAAEVARRAGISRTQMTFYRAYSKLPADVIEIIRSDPSKFGANATYQISKIAERISIKKSALLAAKFSEGNHTYAWLVSQVQSMLEPRPAKQPTNSKQVRFSNGYYKQRGESFEVSIVVDPAKRVRFAADLERLLATVAEEAQEVDQEDGSSAEGSE